MPHIIIKCYKGRSKEQLQMIADKIAACAAKEFELSKDVVSVSIEEIDKDKWSEIYHNDIYGNTDTLFVEPKYTVD